MKAFTPPPKLHDLGQETALDRLHGFSITGNSQSMRQQMLDDVKAMGYQTKFTTLQKY